MPEFILVCFASNDDRGHNRGWFDAIEFGDGDVSLTGPATRLRHIGGTEHFKGHAILLNDSSNNWSAGPMQQWIGNMAWNGCYMTVPEARGMLGWLLQNGFTVDEAALQGPLADIANGPYAERAEKASRHA